MALLAHQGGWDETLLTVALFLGMLGMSRLRRRSPKAPEGASPTPPAAGPLVCAYCGGPLTPTDVRCLSCGFRTPAVEG